MQFLKGILELQSFIGQVEVVAPLGLNVCVHLSEDAGHHHMESPLQIMRGASHSLTNSGKKRSHHKMAFRTWVQGQEERIGNDSFSAGAENKHDQQRWRQAGT